MRRPEAGNWTTREPRSRFLRPSAGAELVWRSLAKSAHDIRSQLQIQAVVLTPRTLRNWRKRLVAVVLRVEHLMRLASILCLCPSGRRMHPSGDGRRKTSLESMNTNRHKCKHVSLRTCPSHLGFLITSASHVTDAHRPQASAHDVLADSRLRRRGPPRRPHRHAGGTGAGELLGWLQRQRSGLIAVPVLRRRSGRGLRLGARHMQGLGNGERTPTTT